MTNQLLTHHLLYLVPGMNGDLNKVDFLLVSCLYNKQNNTWLLGNMEYLFKCSTSYLTFLLHSLVRYQVEHSKGKYIFEHLHTILHMLWALHQHNNSGLKKTGFRFLKCDINN